MQRTRSEFVQPQTGINCEVDMLERLTIQERVAGVAALAGVLCSYLTWASFVSGFVRTNLTGFRVSIFGDVFAVASGAVLLALAIHLRLVRLPRLIDHRRIIRTASTVALAAVILQLLFSLDQGQQFHVASGIALVSAAAMFLSSRRQAQRTVGNF